MLHFSILEGEVVAEFMMIWNIIQEDAFFYKIVTKALRHFDCHWHE